jgi:hypothetical protein
MRIIAIFLLLFPISALSCILVNETANSRLENSDLIFIGKVVQSTLYSNKKLVKATFNISEFIKGSSPNNKIDIDFEVIEPFEVGCGVFQPNVGSTYLIYYKIGVQPYKSFGFSSKAYNEHDQNTINEVAALKKAIQE